MPEVDLDIQGLVGYVFVFSDSPNLNNPAKNQRTTQGFWGANINRFLLHLFYIRNFDVRRGCQVYSKCFQPENFGDAFQSALSGLEPELMRFKYFISIQLLVALLHKMFVDSAIRRDLILFFFHMKVN